MKSKRLAVALKYEENEQDAPVIVAAGQGELADKIIKTAQQANIPIHMDESLVQLLINLEIGTEIPPELYAAVAQVLVFVWKLDDDTNQKVRKK